MSKAGFHAASFKVPRNRGLDNTASTPTCNASTSSAILSPAGSAASRTISSGFVQKNASDAGAQKSSSVYLRNRQGRSPYVREIDTNMASYDAAHYNAPTAKRSQAKLHKRGGSDSSTSLPGPPSALKGSVEAFSTPFATYEEPSQHASHTPSGSSTPKLKPYLRKMSAANAKEDQGKLDLSRSAVENDRLAGLGIQEFGSRSAADVAFSHSNRRAVSHSRTISGGSQISTGSGPQRPSQTFVHPMRQTPRPYTPPHGRSNAASFNDDEANESSDVVDDDFRLGHGFRTRRSMSISSTPQIPPTPLSQSHTASDLGLVPKITSGSQTNLSIKSSRSGKSSKSRLGRSRRDTSRSQEQPISPSTRTSFDMAVSFVSRKSDLEPQTREERIQAARRKFEEKEAGKSRKAEKEIIKRRDTEHEKRTLVDERRPSRADASERPRSNPKLPSFANGARKGRRKDSKRDSMSEKLDARPYEEYRESNEASLPIQGRKAGASEKVSRGHAYNAKSAQSGWVRFEAWFRTRMLSCGEERA